MTRSRVIGDGRTRAGIGRVVTVPIGDEGCVIDMPAWARALVRGAAAEPRKGAIVRSGELASLVSVEMSGARRMTAAEFGQGIELLIGRALELLGATAAPWPVRVWNFLPGIFDAMGSEMDRYRAFNLARHRALGARLGVEAVSRGELPAASCVGHEGESVMIHMLGAATAGMPIENPRQVPAFEYSRRYGVRPPCFARATRTSFGGRSMVLVAGTASVVGEDSAHVGCLESQARETSANLSTVLASARGKATGALTGVTSVRIYHAHADDRAALARWLPVELIGAPEVEWVRADICRPELKVEIEVVADAG